LLIRDGNAVAGGEIVSEGIHSSLKNLEPRRPPTLDLVRNGLSGQQRSQKQAGILMNGQRAIGAIGRGDQTKPASLLLLAHRKLFVARLESLPLRQEPDLVEMDPLLLGRIELTMPYPRACGHVLHLTRAQDGAVAEAVPVFERPFEDAGDDLDRKSTRLNSVT